MATSWKNLDGLVQYYGPRTVENTRPGIIGGVDELKTLVIDFDYNDVTNDVVAPVDGDGGVNYLPAGAFLVSAKLQVGTAFATSTTASLNLGFAQQDGTAIDIDGIDATIAVAALTANTVITCDGADVGTVVDASNDAYVKIADAVGTFTAGTARLVLEYKIPVAFDSGVPATV